MLISVAAAQEPALPKLLRFEVSPFLGYRTTVSFPIDPHVQGTNPRVVLDASPSYGVALGLRINEDDLVELRWASSHGEIPVRRS